MTEYDPRQLLEAGQLAEQRQQTADAMRIYAYVADRFPDTMESRVARDAYKRAAAQVNGLVPDDRGGGAPKLDTKFENGIRAGQPAAAQPGRANAAAPVSASGRGAGSSRQRPMPEVLASPRPSYGVGAVAAKITLVFGWLFVLTGLIALVGGVAVLADPSLVAQTGLGVPPAMVGAGALGGGILIGLIGLNIVMVAQVVQANFDTAQAVRLIAEAEYRDQ